MKKITTLVLFTTLFALSATSAVLADNNNSASYDQTAKEYNFENNSYNISDEQLQAETGEQSLESDKKASFWSKIINSSHFSSNTATRTWIPFNKAE